MSAQGNKSTWSRPQTYKTGLETIIAWSASIFRTDTRTQVETECARDHKETSVRDTHLQHLRPFLLSPLSSYFPRPENHH